MATEQLLVRLSMDARQYKKSAREASTATGTIGKSADDSRGRIGKMRAGFAKIGPAASIAGLAATAAIGKFTADSIRDASNLQESLNAVNVVFGDAADEIHAIGEESADSFGLSQRAFGEFAVRFSAFAEQIAEKDGRSIVEVVETMTGRVADFASVHNLSLERAAEVAQSTLAGETEVFRRFGGDVSAAAVEAKLFEEGIVDIGDTVTEQDKILGRYMLFMEQTADTAGDFANTSDDLANKQRIFAATLEDTRAEIGEALLPVMTDLLDVGEDLIPVLVTVGEVIEVIARGAALAMAGDDIERIAIASGGAADSAATLATAIVELDKQGGSGSGPRHMRQQYEDLIDIWGGGNKEIRTLLGGLDFLTEEMGLSGREAEILADILRDELINSLTGGEEAARAAFDATDDYAGGLTDAEEAARAAFDANNNLGDAIHDLDPEMRALFGSASDVADAQREVEITTSDATTALEAYFNLLRGQLDPVFALQDAAARVADAQQAIADAETPEEQTEAIADLAEANLDLRGAQIDVIGAGERTREEFIKQQTELGLTREQAELLADDLETLEGFEFTPKVISISTRVSGPGSRNIGSFFGSADDRHSGGPGRAGEVYRIRPDEEIYVPSGNGEFLLNNEVIDALRGLSSSSNTTTTNTYNIPVQSTGDPNTDAQLVGSISSVLRRMETL